MTPHAGGRKTWGNWLAHCFEKICVEFIVTILPVWEKQRDTVNGWTGVYRAEKQRQLGNKIQWLETTSLNKGEYPLVIGISSGENMRHLSAGLILSIVAHYLEIFVQ